MPRADREEAGLLSHSDYDHDAASASDHDVDSDDATSIDGKTSLEIAQRDEEILDEEEERQKLVSDTRNGGRSRRMFSHENVAGDKVNIGKFEKRRLRREAGQHHKHRRRGEGSELMYEMEEGGRHSESDSSRKSSYSDQERLARIVGHKTNGRANFARGTAIYLSIAVLFVTLLYAAYRASRPSSQKQSDRLIFNGTSNFAPTTILISLDGFRADFLDRGLTPTLNSFIQNGVSPQYMLPSFPSVTFPNHYTLATGLYPESHGIVGNTFWDPELQDEFHYTNPLAMQPKWWRGEPLWVTAENQGIRTAIHMWPGSEAHIEGIEPAHLDKYNGSEELGLKVDRILELLDLPGPDSPSALFESPRPQLIAAYVPVVDSDGHKYGPNSTEIRQTIGNVDTMLSSIFVGLEERNLTDVVNVVVVSDHGMATTSVERLIQLEDLIDTSLIEHVDGWPLYGLRPKNPDDLDALYHQLREKADRNPNFHVYLRDKDMPERYHFSNNERIAPLWIVPQTGWAIVTKDEFNVQEGLRNGDIYHPRGLHGYDHEHPLMRAIFVARGPAFPHKPGSRVEVFQNTEVYNIVCDSIGVIPKANNGTLRLPLKPVGLHSDEDTPTLDTPYDPPPAKTSKYQSVSLSQPLASQAGTTAPSPHSLLVTTSSELDAAPTQPPVHDGTGGESAGGTSNQDGERKSYSWWDWIEDQLHGIKNWAEGILDKGASADQ